MFFTKYIKSNRRYNRIAIILINIIVIILKSIRIVPKVESDNIVIISLHRLGDAVFTISAIKKILHHHKENIFLVCYKETIPIYKIIFDSIYYIGLCHQDFFLKLAKIKTIRKINNLRPSVIYDITGNITSASLLIYSTSKESVGINEPYYRSIYTKYVNIRSNPHITDIYLDAISPKIYDTKPEKNQIQSDLNNYILIHPFAGYPSKEWGLKNFIYLAELLNNRFNCYIISPPYKISRDIIEYVLAKNIKIIQPETTNDLIEIIKKCSLYIGNDSGPNYIANLLGKPIFTIYGPTNPEFHVPLEGVSEFVIKNIKCSPERDEKVCLTLGGVFCPSYECMNNLSFDNVKIKLEKYIEYLELVKNN